MNCSNINCYRRAPRHSVVCQTYSSYLRKLAVSKELRLLWHSLPWLSIDSPGQLLGPPYIYDLVVLDWAHLPSCHKNAFAFSNLICSSLLEQQIAFYVHFDHGFSLYHRILAWYLPIRHSFTCSFTVLRPRQFTPSYRSRLLRFCPLTDILKAQFLEVDQWHEYHD